MRTKLARTSRYAGESLWCDKILKISTSYASLSMNQTMEELIPKISIMPIQANFRNSNADALPGSLVMHHSSTLYKMSFTDILIFRILSRYSDSKSKEVH
ncbi:hypothetical protein AG1IA_09398 [Rhizoctonia solani AG-1 IA]|uniref:Uncharacterized protein n=1 Tax=Thanatephorus cucumeris (strain AG1-IA) TaxID=983506 RepID=L8WEE7_THACA|nr:hypothetical protein AG1IA_09398 [Rhizoctonia solani AG-1 IA]